jgi:hypothetical protein
MTDVKFERPTLSRVSDAYVQAESTFPKSINDLKFE